MLDYSSHAAATFFVDLLKLARYEVVCHAKADAARGKS